MDSIVSGNAAMTVIVSAIALAAVWLPLYRGLRLCLDARAATRRIEQAELRSGLRQGSGARVEPLALVMARVMSKSLRESEGYPRDFVIDASRQYVVNEYDSHYAQLISMYSNLLPPIGFIGTTGGMLILFLSMHLGDESLELGALAVALTSSIFALIGFALLEGLKIRLYTRLLECLDHVLALQRASDRNRGRGQGDESAMPGREPAPSAG